MSAQDAALAMRRLARRTVEHKVHELGYAVVDGTDPLIATHEDGMELDDDDLVLGFAAKKFDADHTIDVGDTLVVKLMKNGDWLVTDVVSDKEVT